MAAADTMKGSGRNIAAEEHQDYIDYRNLCEQYRLALRRVSPFTGLLWVDNLVTRLWVVAGSRGGCDPAGAASAQRAAQTSP